MKKISFFLLLLLPAGLVYGQKILTVDFDQIKKQVDDPSSSFYYEKLVTRFIKGDTLSIEALRCLYYGAAVKEAGNTSSFNSVSGEENGFNEHFRKEEFREAVPYGLKLLEADPVNIRQNYKLLICYHKLGLGDSARLFARRYYGLLKAIQSSGDGTTISTAFVVTKVPDEYDVLRTAGFRSTGQTLLEPESGHTDKLSLDTAVQEQEPKIPALYFNVEMSFIAMSKLLEGVELSLPEEPKTKK